MSLKEKFTSISPAEFFKRNPELAGFSNPARAMYQALRELVENALDATDVHEILPSLKVIIERTNQEKEIYRLTVEDNGIGIPPHVVPDAFGRVLYSSKYVLRQTRGMYGLGVKAAVLYSQMYQDKPIEIVTAPINSKRTYFFKLKIDVTKNEPIIYERGSVFNEAGTHGTAVSMYILGDWMRAKSRIYEYIKRTYIITPYAEFYFKDPEGNVIFYPRLTTKIPPPPKEVKPHPYGVDIELLKNMISRQKDEMTVREFLIKEFQGVGEKTAQSVVELAGLDPDKKVKKLSDEQLSKLVDAMKNFPDFRSPSPEPLSIIGSDLIELGLRQSFNPEYVGAVTRRPKAYQGHPFIVEVGLAYGGDIQPSEEPTVLRYANKIPLIYDEKSDVIWKVVEEIDWKRYGIEEEQIPLVVMVHLCSTKVPYKSAGKESIADVEEIEKEIRNGIMEASRSLKTFISEKRKGEETRKRLLTYLKYIPEISRSLSIFMADGKKDVASKIQEELKNKLMDLVITRLNIKEQDLELFKSYKVEEL
ncbi:DNA topoisomerase VI subunit B [Metallosphaera tengchongensis]|uniref:Type 2 DNA topoisomerase 6 subunit B n=1 Tax=Metallosphaera tengchongensis TaxID=1532350 RepID=A0A6N0NR90_9CREN|nr:DNA topoisomerase VI subunit B [Metallosphaera tengchongensis]QKQ99393.1 DNA topoisomerase VI subunit B [Metallosphaera tengchongensis]